MKSIIKYISILFVLISLPSVSQSQCEILSDFNTYEVNGMSPFIEWTPISSTSVVCNSSEWQPSFFINSDSLLNVKITGEIYISSTTNDDDFIGFVFGYRSPVSSTISNNNHYYLFDWRKNAQHAPDAYGNFFANEGFSLSKANGLIPEDPINTYKRFWAHQTSEEFKLIDYLYGSDYGWEYNTTYSFELIYTQDKIIIKIDDMLIFDVDGCFEPGFFGLYSFSQNSVIYRNVVSQQYYSLNVDSEDEIVCEEVPVGFSFINSNCFSVPESLLSYTWNFGDGTSQSNELYPSHAFIDAGAYEVELYLEDLNNCIDTIRKTIFVDPKPIIHIQPDDIECLVGDAITFSVQVENAQSYEWYYQEEGTTYFAKLYNNGYFSGVNSANLHIYNVRPDHDLMKFRCVTRGNCENNPVTSTFGQIFISDIPVRAHLAPVENDICNYDSTLILLTLKELYLIKSAKMRIVFDTNCFEVTGYTNYLQSANFNLEVIGNIIEIDFSVYNPINLNEALLASIKIKPIGNLSDIHLFEWDNEGTYFKDPNGDPIIQILYYTYLTTLEPIQANISDTIKDCEGSSIHLDENLFSNIQWSNGGNTSSFLLENEGDFWVDLTDKNGCVSKEEFYVSPILGPKSPTSINIDQNYYCSYDEEILFDIEGGEGKSLELHYAGKTLIDSVFQFEKYNITNPGESFTIAAYWNNRCGRSQVYEIDVPVIQEVTPSVSIFTPNEEIGLGENVHFTAIAQGIESNPYFIWKLDNVTKQTGYDYTFVTNELKHNQTLSLGLYSDARCILGDNYTEDEKQINLNAGSEYFVPSIVHVNGSSSANSFRVVFRVNEIYYYKLQIYDISGRLLFETSDRYDEWKGKYLNNGSLNMYTYSLRFSTNFRPEENQIEYVSGKFILMK